jgi:hypothetical protein
MNTIKTHLLGGFGCVAVRISLLLIGSVLATVNVAMAYDEPTHEILTKLAVRRSVLQTDPSLLVELGLPSYFQGLYPIYSGNPQVVSGTASPIDAAVWGSREEDAGDKPLNHFFDPQNNRPLELPPGNFLGQRSIDWATEHGNANYPEQFYSFRDAQVWFYYALALSSPADRQAAIGRVFQTLGHISHHIQDMSQPQHVRNEAHGHGKSYPLPDQNTADYEKYTTAYVNPIIEEQIGSGAWRSYLVPLLTSIKDYWASGNGTTIGMADYTSRNFVTFKTGLLVEPSGDISPYSFYMNFQQPNGVNPDGTRYKVESQRVTRVNVKGELVTGYVNYLLGTVRDDFAGNVSNVRIAAESSVQQFRSTSTGRPALFAAKDDNVWADGYSVLIPRAVAFSAGVINHFFRGRLQMTNIGPNRWSVRNATGYSMSGAIAIYAEAANGIRTQATSATSVALASGAAFAIDVPVSAVPAKLVAVFQGAIGADDGMTAGVVVPYVAPPTAIPCGGSISSRGGPEGFATTMDMGSTAGQVSVAFEAYMIPDSLSITSQNGPKTSIANSGGYVNGYRTYSYDFDPDALGSRYVTVKVTGNSDQGTRWELSVSCPGGGTNLPSARINVGFTVVGATCQVTNTYIIDGQYTIEVRTGQTKGLSLSPGPHTFNFAGQSLSTGCTGYGHPGYTDGRGGHDIWTGVGAASEFWVCPSSSNCISSGPPW